MLCDNCGKNEATIKLTQIINGIKTEMNVCKECGREIGIVDMTFEMPIDISNFLGDFVLGEESDGFLPFSMNNEILKCNKCNMTYEEFLNNGKFGCEECYKTFNDKIDVLLQRIQGTNKYLGKKANHSEEAKIEDVKQNNKLESLQNELKLAIKEERYEDAAKIRDEIRKEGLL